MAYIFLLFLFLACLLIFFLVVGIYNNLIIKKNHIDRAFGSVDILLKKRCDLIPNLVSVVKNYMQFEQKTLVEVIKLRSRVMSGEVSEEQRFTLENQISRTMGNILALIENYPELKANQHITQLLASLNEIEEQISAARRFYNTAVTEYNNAIEIFPNNLIAARMNYRLKKVFEATEVDRSNVDVGQLFS